MPLIFFVYHISQALHINIFLYDFCYLPLSLYKFYSYALTFNSFLLQIMYDYNIYSRAYIGQLMNMFDNLNLVFLNSSLIISISLYLCVLIFDTCNGVDNNSYIRGMYRVCSGCGGEESEIKCLSRSMQCFTFLQT